MATDSKSISRNVVTAADLLAGATLPVKLTLNVTLVQGFRGDTASDDPTCAHRGSPDIESRLAQYAPQLLRFASQSSDNAALLLTNPLDALVRSEAKATAGDKAALAQHLRTVMPTEVLPPGVELVSIKVTVAEGRKP